MTRKLSPLNVSLDAGALPSSSPCDKPSIGASIGDYIATVTHQSRSRRNDPLSKSMAVDSSRKDNKSATLSVLGSTISSQRGLNREYAFEIKDIVESS